MSGFTERFERLELKFLIDETRATRIRAQIEPYCIPDGHSREPARDRSGRAGYQISSLYLDTPGLAFHRAKERGDADRVKLRVRTYAGGSSGTLEVKRRRSDMVDKTRAVVSRASVREAALGLAVSPESESTRYLDDFRWIVSTSGARPTLLVRYEREAYESWVDAYARVTFDRRIEVRRTSTWDLDPTAADGSGTDGSGNHRSGNHRSGNHRSRNDGWCAFDEHWSAEHATTPVVMEIKCEAAIPAWVEDLIRSNDLVRTSFSKYSIGIDLTASVDGRLEGRSRAAKALA